MYCQSEHSYDIFNMDVYKALVAQMVESARNAGDQVRSLGGEDLLEKGMETHSSSLAWRIPWTEQPDRLQLQRVGHD